MIAVYSRVAKAADEIFANSGDKAKIPKVDDVRRLAAVSMNDASNGMEIWRKRKLREAESAPVSVPESVMQRFVSSLGEAWMEAQQLANNSLQAAQKSWDLERDEFERERINMAESFDLQAQELADLKKEILKVEELARHDAETAAQKLFEANAEVTAKHEELLQVQGMAVQFDIRVEDVGKRVVDLHAELERAYVQIDDMKNEAKNVATEFERLRREAVNITSKLAESEAKHAADINKHSEQYNRAISINAEIRDERDKERKAVVVAHEEANIAREAAAELRGELKGAQQQISELLKQISAPLKEEGKK